MQLRYGFILLLCAFSVGAMEKEKETPVEQEKTIQFFRADMELDAFTQEMMKHDWKNGLLQEGHSANPFVQIVSQVKKECTESENAIDLTGPEATELLQAFNSDEKVV